MNEEIYELLKIQNPNNNGNDGIVGDKMLSCAVSLNHANIKIISSQLTDAMCKSLKEKTQGNKSNIYLKFVKNLCKHHEKPQCINKKNINIYLKSLPISKENECDKALFVSDIVNTQEIYDFYREQVAKHNERQKHKEMMNMHVQTTFPEGFDYIPRKELQLAPFQFEIISDHEKLKKQKCFGSDESNLSARTSTIKFAMAVMNLNMNEEKNANTNLILCNVTERLRKYEELQTIEIDYLALLYKQCEKFGLNKEELLDAFPLLLEHKIINIATNYLQGKLTQAEIPHVKSHFAELIHNNELIRSKCNDICYELFALSNYHFDLLDKLLNIINN